MHVNGYVCFSLYTVYVRILYYEIITVEASNQHCSFYFIYTMCMKQTHIDLTMSVSVSPSVCQHDSVQEQLDGCG
jgi:hypothetical protein